MLSKISQKEIQEALQEFYELGGQAEKLPPEQEPNRETVGMQKRWAYAEVWWE